MNPIIGEARRKGLMRVAGIMRDHDSKEPTSDLVSDFFDVTRDRG